MPNVTSEVVAARHAKLGQAARNNFSSPQASDQASPFAALLDDGASDLSPPPTSPVLTPSAPPGPKAAPRPPDDHVASSSSDQATSKQKSTADSATAGAPAAGGTPAPSEEPHGDDAAQAALALVALAKKTAKDANQAIDPSVVAAATASAPVIPVINAAATAASSTAAALIDLHTGGTSDSSASDCSASDTSQAATPPADPTAGASAPVTPQPVAVPISLPVILPAPVVSSSDDASGQAAAQIAALGEAVKAGALRADRAGADATKAGNPADDRTGGTAKPGAKAAAAPATLQPTDAQNALTGAGQGNAANAAQSGDASGIPAAKAAAERARQRAVDSQPNNEAASPPDDATGTDGPNAATKPEPVGSPGRIEDIVRQALDTTARHVEAATAEATGGAPHPGGMSADSAALSPDGASGMVAPAVLTTAAAATAATVTSPTPVAVPIAGLAVEIASHALGGKNRFEIRLDPPELGRIDVRLDVDRDGKVTSRLVVDRPETLDILRRDAPALERSLQQAGLKTADDALQFSLRDQGGSGGQNPYSPNHGSPENTARALIPDRGLPAVAVAAAGYSRVSGTSAGVDIRV